MRREISSPLIIGGKLRCPRCGTVRDILDWFAFDRLAPFEDELNVVYKCRARVVRPDGEAEACRYIFSPGIGTRELIHAA